MGRRKKTAADIKRRLIDDEREVSPFASIRLVEKKEEKKAVPVKKAQPVPKKKPSEIVQGYDPSSSFADILYSYEHTGNPYSMPRPSKGQKKGPDMDFGAILDKWEGRVPESGKKKRDGENRKRSSYTPSRSFGDILSSFESRDSSVKVPSAPAKETEREEILSDNLFRKPSEGEEMSSAASWSVFGGRNENFVRKSSEDVKPDRNEGMTEDSGERSSYTPSRSFADILSDYENQDRQKEDAMPASAPDEKTETVQDVPLSDSLFRKPSDGETRAPGVAWSVFGGNEGFVRPQPEMDDAVTEEEKPESRQTYQPSSSFGVILEQYARTPREKTFDEYMKEKGDDERKKETVTLSRLRTMAPQSTLDLHGYTAKEAEEAVRSFLSECHENGIRKISIITGKGLHSEDGVGVLKTAVLAVLDESGMVSEKTSAPLSAGGSGALWIILKA